MNAAERSELTDRLIRAISIAAIILALAVAAAVLFEWTLAGAPSFDLMADPAGDLPF